MEEKRNRDTAIRATIRAARERHGFQEKDVNEAFHQILTAKGIKGPRAIMTRVRDKRRELVFTKAEAIALAEVLKIDPSPLLPRDAQPSLLVDQEEEGSSPAADSKQSQEETPQSKPATSGEPVTHELEQTQPKRSEQASHTPERDCAHKITVTPSRKGLFLQIDYIMSRNQFERFTLAIPAYMTRYEHAPSGIRVRAGVEIFPYQAELVMRAIFGKK